MDKKNTGVLGFILLLIGILVSFINIFIGLVITVIAFILSLFNKEKKGTLTKVTLVLSIIAICVQIFLLVVAFKTVSDSRNNASNMLNSINENRFQQQAELYFYKEIYTNQNIGNSGELFATMSEMNENIKGCDGYAIFNIETKETKAYIECGKYKTPGFDDSKIKNHKDESNLSKDNLGSVELKNIRTDANKIIEKFDVEMNGKNKIFTVEYESLREEDYASIKGNITGATKTFTFNDTDEDTAKFINDNFNENNIKNIIDIDNFHFIKGEDDKTYLLLVIRTENFVSGHTDFLYVYNDELKLVTGDVDYNGCSNNEAFTIRLDSSYNRSEEEPGYSGYKDSSNVWGLKNLNRNSYQILKLENNKLHYLKAIQDNITENDYGTLEERIYTIKNNKLEYSVKNTFKIKYISDQAC